MAPVILALALTYFRVQSPLWGIAAGPDGNLWFPTATGIVKMTTSGETTIYPTPEPISGRARIALGPDGRMWFTEPYQGRIGAITLDGALTEYTIRDTPLGIAAGSDGNVWFGAIGAGGRITPSGDVTIVPLGGNAEVRDLALGPDGAIWFVQYPQNFIGRITPDGLIDRFPVEPVCCVQPLSITRGGDGGLWFTVSGGTSI